MKILITGGTGFLSSHMGRELYLDGHKIIFLSRTVSVSAPEGIPNFVYHDLRAPFTPNLVEELQDVDCIVHAAAEASGTRSSQAPVVTTYSNVLGTFNVLELCRQLPKLTKMIYCSSTDVLGPQKHSTFASEDVPLRPTSVYAATKAGAEELVRVWSRGYRVPGVVVRYSNLFGSGQKLRYTVPTLIREIVTNVVPKVYDASRCWLHVDDAVAWTKVVIERGLIGETYHVVGPEITNEQVALTICSALGRVPLWNKLIVPPAHYAKRHAAWDTKLGMNVSPRSVRSQLKETARWYHERFFPMKVTNV